MAEGVSCLESRFSLRRFGGVKLRDGIGGVSLLGFRAVQIHQEAVHEIAREVCGCTWLSDWDYG
jgi:hypothetical protein